jgi:hypothetical protein
VSSCETNNPSIASSSNFSSSIVTEENWISDSDLTDYLTNFCLDYLLRIPDNSTSYPTIWYGDDPNNKYGSIPPIYDRFYAFETEYSERNKDDLYYACYVNNYDLDILKNYAKQYQDLRSGDRNNYYFTDYLDDETIDGKYLLPIKYYQLNLQSYWMTSNSIGDLKVNINDKKLVFVSDSKNAKILENISLKKPINKMIKIFNPISVNIGENGKLADSQSNSYFHVYSKDLFDYVGRRIETFPLSYEDIDSICLPQSGLIGLSDFITKRIDIIIDDNLAQMLIPRYQKDPYSEEFSYDSLNEVFDMDNSSFYQDLFGSEIDEFRKAFVSDSEICDYNFKYSLFNYDIVCDIIK